MVTDRDHMAFNAAAVTMTAAAEVVYEAQRAWVANATGKRDLPPWSQVDKEVKTATVGMVMEVARFPSIKPEELHYIRYSTLLQAGWRYGETHDPDARTDPNIVEYPDLPPHLKVHARLIVSCSKAIVQAMIPAEVVERYFNALDSGADAFVTGRIQ